ncbi:MAG: hypothetical protein CM1200mP3_06150 [Chloroflexota bacterium]|nr:MAG: hypothetical protein CM1200mP3_06150 [Chloroflexota bacterium]
MRDPTGGRSLMEELPVVNNLSASVIDKDSFGL